MEKSIKNMNSCQEMREASQDVVLKEVLEEVIKEAMEKRFRTAHVPHFFYPKRRMNQITSWIDSLDNWRHTVGILIADYEQQLAREYILNYVELFNQESDKYIDFYMPGYVCLSSLQTISDDIAFSIGGTKYKFDRELFNLVITELRELCGIKYGFAPLLILQEFENGSMTDKRIVIELNTEKAGLLFEEIFSIAHREVNIEAFSKELKMAQFKRLMPQIIKEGIKKLTGSSFIKVVVDNTDNLTHYNIKDRKE